MATTLDRAAPAADADRAVSRKPPESRLAVLDGWRAVSILLVLAAHMLPLGPRSLGLNGAAAVAGMSCFFTLSGFLITSTIHKHPTISTFLIRRTFRILPAAYLTMGIYLMIQQKPWSFYAPHYLFYVNYDHPHATSLTAVFWSLCVEIHFYVLAAALLATAGFRGLLALPALGLAITGLKIHQNDPHSIVTHLRADEIMVGVTLALIWLGTLGGVGRGLGRIIAATPWYAWAALFGVSSLEASGPLQFAQPYLAGAMIGGTLLSPRPSNRWLTTKTMRYIAEISYSLYVIHPGVTLGWLGSGDRFVKYMKRPLAFLLLWALAHTSTFTYERAFILAGKRLCRWIEGGGSGVERSKEAVDAQAAAPA